MISVHALTSSQIKETITPNKINATIQMALAFSYVTEHGNYLFNEFSIIHS